MSLQYFLKLLNALGRSDPLQSILGGLLGALYEELNFQSSFIGFISLFQISVSHWTSLTFRLLPPCLSIADETTRAEVNYEQHLTHVKIHIYKR